MACPAHARSRAPIRLIGHYAESCMINWGANVFPGILDRPSKPACRRGRATNTVHATPGPGGIDQCAVFRSPVPESGAGIEQRAFGIRTLCQSRGDVVRLRPDQFECVAAELR
jgi:hypothetical protein